ncbi:MAG TPA: 6-phosphogluconolactonase [Novosphingobium sp.]|nr:6-phosphogluconolactonase [Novosphingobium sp.]HNN55251.1 6-phosphogluconolactonase [Novosphingobium sp.]
MIEPRWAEDGSDRAVADYLAARIGAGARRIALPGGKTPIGILDLLAQADLPWAKLTLALVDDRMVPPDHPASNFGLLSRALAGKPVRIEPLAEGPCSGGRFDLVWLGMGADGHIASIFPGSGLGPDLPAAVVRTVPDPLPPEAPFARLTMTCAALTDADEIVLVVRGEAKRAVLQGAIAGESDLPIARLLAAAASPVTIFWTA